MSDRLKVRKSGKILFQIQHGVLNREINVISNGYKSVDCLTTALASAVGGGPLSIWRLGGESSFTEGTEYNHMTVHL